MDIRILGYNKDCFSNYNSLRAVSKAVSRIPYKVIHTQEGTNEKLSYQLLVAYLELWCYNSLQKQIGLSYIYKIIQMRFSPGKMWLVCRKILFCFAGSSRQGPGSEPVNGAAGRQRLVDSIVRQPCLLLTMDARWQCVVAVCPVDT